MVHRILIADKLAAAGAASLRSEPDVELTERVGLAGDDLADALRAHDGVVVRSAVTISADVLDRCMSGDGSRLRGIARAGVGVDNIDLPAATRHGIAVMNSASASTITTAEHAFALLMALARNIAPAAAAMREGGWDRSRFTGTQLDGKTIGIVGMGRIGQTLARRAAAFGMTVLGCDPFVNAETLLGGTVRMVPSFTDLLAEVDIVSFHVPRTAATAGMLDREAFRAARPGLLVVNAARGGIIDEEALLEALDEGRCAGAAIDVFSSEPPPSDSPLRTHPRILATPHLGASTSEAQRAVAVDACSALLAFLRGEALRGAINVGGIDLDLDERQRAFVDLADRMMALLNASSRGAPVSAVRVTLRGGRLAERAETIGRLALASLLSRHLAQPVSIVNATHVASDRGIDVETSIGSDQGEDRLAIELVCRDGEHRVDGTIFEDRMPRVTHLDDCAMDMIPAGPMVLLHNTDQPGRIGLVGRILGEAGVNIAEMVIGRSPRPPSGDRTAMMVLKLDEPPGDGLLEALRGQPGILRVTALELADVEV